MSAVERASQHAQIDTTQERQQPIEHEEPADWGWHANLSKWARLGGILSIIVLLLGLTATHYNNAGTAAIFFCVGVLVLGLIVDQSHRKRSFRG
jgi:uncharacterized membrane protein YdcZ (DUF606 family)